MPRHLVALGVGVVVVVVSLACNGAAPPPAQAPVVHHDVQRLGEIVLLPPSTVSASWTYEPIAPGGLGPTDYRLIAYIEVATVDELDVLYGPETPSDGPLWEAYLPVLSQAAIDALPRLPTGELARSGGVRYPSQVIGMHVDSVYSMGTHGVFFTGITH